MLLFLAAGDTWIEMCRQQADVLEFKASDYRHRNLESWRVQPFPLWCSALWFQTPQLRSPQPRGLEGSLGSLESSSLLSEITDLPCLWPRV